MTVHTTSRTPTQWLVWEAEDSIDSARPITAWTPRGAIESAAESIHDIEPFDDITLCVQPLDCPSAEPLRFTAVTERVPRFHIFSPDDRRPGGVREVAPDTPAPMEEPK
jgi:hypothetical protein